MKQRPLLILLVVFVALLIVAYWQIQPGPATTNAEFVANLPYLGKDLNYSLSDIVAVRLRDPRNEQVFVLGKDASGSLEAPLHQGSLNQAQASNILKSVVVLLYNNTIPITETTRLEDFGFAPEGILAIEILLADGQGHGISVGNQTPTGDGYYALVDNRPQIYVLERGVVEYLHFQLSNPPLT